jgi:hypothetical protein
VTEKMQENLVPVSKPPSPIRVPQLPEPFKDHLVEVSKPPSPIRVPQLPEPFKDRGALNPIEKRRKMVVSHLALANPNRLARNRRLVLEKESASTNSSNVAENGSTQRSPTSAVSSTTHVADTDPQSSAEARATERSTTSCAQELDKYRHAPRSRPRSANRDGGDIATIHPPDLDSPRNRTPKRHHLISSILRDQLKRPESPLHSHRGKPQTSSQLDAPHDRGLPSDLFLKEDLDDDPLDVLARSMCQSLAQHSPTGCKSSSAGFSMAAPSLGGSLRLETTDDDLLLKPASAPGSSENPSKRSTPPGTASTMDTLGMSAPLSLGGSLTSSWLA